MEDIKLYYPNFCLDTHLQAMIEQGKKNKEVLDRLDNTLASKLYKLLRGNGWYIERTPVGPLYLEVSKGVEVGSIKSLLDEYNCVYRDTDTADSVSVYIQDKELLYDELVELSEASSGRLVSKNPDSYHGF